MLEPEQAEAALAAGLTQIRNNSRPYSLYRGYYRGDHPQVWLTERLRDMFSQHPEFVDKIGVENWCGVVVDTPVKRLSVKGFSTQAAASEANQAESFWNTLSLDRDETTLYGDVLTVGAGYLVAFNGDNGIEVDINEPEVIAWGPQRRASQPPAWASKIWPDTEAGTWRGTVWDDTRIWRYIGPRLSRSGGHTLPDSINGFVLDSEDEGGAHGFDRVPVQRFDLGRNAVPILETIRRPQDRLNKLMANKMVAAEFAAFRQRYFLTGQPLEDGYLETGPDRAIVLHPGPADGQKTQVGEFDATPLANYDEAIDRERDSIFSLASLPRHLNVAKSGAGTSGDAFKAAEGPFIEFLQSIQRQLGACWADFFELLGLDVEVEWVNAETRDTSSESQAVKTLVDAGVPLELALKTVAGWEPEQLEELARIREEQKAEGEMDRVLGQLSGLGKAGSLGALDPDTVRATAHSLLGINQPGAPSEA